MLYVHQLHAKLPICALLRSSRGAALASSSGSSSLTLLLPYALVVAKLYILVYAEIVRILLGLILSPLNNIHAQHLCHIQSMRKFRLLLGLGENPAGFEVVTNFLACGQQHWRIALQRQSPDDEALQTEYTLKGYSGRSDEIPIR